MPRCAGQLIISKKGAFKKRPQILVSWSRGEHRNEAHTTDATFPSWFQWTLSVPSKVGDVGAMTLSEIPA